MFYNKNLGETSSGQRISKICWRLLHIIKEDCQSCQWSFTLSRCWKNDLTTNIFDIRFATLKANYGVLIFLCNLFIESCDFYCWKTGIFSSDVESHILLCLKKLANATWKAESVLNSSCIFEVFDKICRRINFIIGNRFFDFLKKTTPSLKNSG